MKNELILFGVLVGVDFTKKGEFKNEDGDIIKYDDCIKLKVNVPVSIVKQGISTVLVNQVTLKLPIAESVEADVSYYNKLVGKSFQVPLVPTNNQVFTIFEKPKFQDYKKTN